MASIYDFIVKDKKGNDVSMADYKGKVLLIVNTATGCGFTPQYSGLQEIYDKYKDQGFEILDFPCNQFAMQAPGSDEKIGTFCQARYGITFKQFKKIKVNGSEADPLYKFLKSEQGGKLFSNIKWNFTKFLVDRDGKVVARFAPSMKPENLENNIKELL